VPTGSEPVVDTAPELDTATSGELVVVAKVTGPLLPVVAIWSVKVALDTAVVVFDVGLLWEMAAAVRHGNDWPSSPVAPLDATSTFDDDVELAKVSLMRVVAAEAIPVPIGANTKTPHTSVVAPRRATDCEMRRRLSRPGCRAMSVPVGGGGGPTARIRARQ